MSSATAGKQVRRRVPCTRSRTHRVTARARAPPVDRGTKLSADRIRLESRQESRRMKKNGLPQLRLTHTDSIKGNQYTTQHLRRHQYRGQACPSILHSSTKAKHIITCATTKQQRQQQQRQQHHQQQRQHLGRRQEHPSPADRTRISVARGTPPRSSLHCYLRPRTITSSFKDTVAPRTVRSFMDTVAAPSLLLWDARNQSVESKPVISVTTL